MYITNIRLAIKLSNEESLSNSDNLEKKQGERYQIWRFQQQMYTSYLSEKLSLFDKYVVAINSISSYEDRVELLA